MRFESRNDRPCDGTHGGTREVELMNRANRETPCSVLPTGPREVRGAAAVAAILLILASFVAAPSTAQTIRGTVVEDATGTPIDGALVTLLTEAGDSVSSVIADGGDFVLRAPRAGRYRLRAQRLGYVTTETRDIEIAPGVETNVRIAMGTEAVPLDPLHVESWTIPLHPQFADIQERMRQGFGRFITRDEIDAQPGARIVDLLKNIPGARVSRTRFGDPVVQFRARGTLLPLPSDETRVGAYIERNACPVKLYVDGVPWVRDHQVRSDTTRLGSAYGAMLNNEEFMDIHGGDVEVIEVYSGPASMPGIFGGSDAECGVVAVWLRRTHEQAVIRPGPRPGLLLGFPLPDPNVTVSFHRVSGRDSPGAGPGVEASARWRTLGNTSLGLFVRRSTHTLLAETTARLTSAASDTRYVLPAGSRGLTIWVAGVEPRIELPRFGRIRPALGARVQFAHRGFALQSTFEGNRDIPVTSAGWGAGVSAAVAFPLARRFTADVAIGRDWLSFGGYRELDRPWNPTSADWRAMGLRLGIEYGVTR
jgi:hypothetical protein